MANTKPKKYWSGEVTKRSNALDLDPGVFTWSDPKRIARSLGRSAQQSTRRKGSPLQSSMSMLNFYLNRAGKNLSARQKKTLDQTKEELRKYFGKKPRSEPRAGEKL
ncbi:MAG TPA: DUF3175 domain-containing protein [Terriglobia bacterium]|nr:DUF3175 domain-containing protein [Terriglobia bacterium]